LNYGDSDAWPCYGWRGCVRSDFSSPGAFLIKPALFYQTGIAYRVFGSKMIEETGGYFRQSIAGSMVFILGYFCVTAVPPSGLFISEFMIFREMYLKGYLWLMAIVMVLLTVIIWALGRNIFRLVFTSPPDSKFETLERPGPVESLSQIALILSVCSWDFSSEPYSIISARQRL
jgi:hydrogenase-4 component F